MNMFEANKFESSEPTHGGDVERVAREFNIGVEELLDFSANINPIGAPLAALQRLQRDAGDVRLLMRYPEADLTELRGAISLYAGVDEAAIVIANGAAALIDACVRAVAMRACEKSNPSTALRCLVPVPAFSEYERALVAADAVNTTFPLRSEGNEGDFQIDVDALCRKLEREQPQLLIITNPHNPSGALTSHDALERIINHARGTDTTVLLDEAFIDYVPQSSLTRSITRHDNLIVLRSLTKFFAIPALRVGYAVASSSEIVHAMRMQIPSWSVTTLAANAAAAALADTQYAKQTIAENQVGRESLQIALSSHGVRVHDSAANFLLLELPPDAMPAGELRAKLIREHRIIVRDCSSYEGLTRNKFLRVAVRNETDNARLVAALSAVLES